MQHGVIHDGEPKGLPLDVTRPGPCLLQALHKPCFSANCCLSISPSWDFSLTLLENGIWGTIKRSTAQHIGASYLTQATGGGRETVF